MTNAPTNSATSAKIEQERVEERQVLLDVVGLLLGELLAGDRLVVLGSGPPSRSVSRIRSRTSVSETPLGRRDLDQIPLADAVHHLLRGGGLERGERRAREPVLLAAEQEDADDRELARLAR